jgi:predicted HicB family RNase H-like nuclease
MEEEKKNVGLMVRVSESLAREFRIARAQTGTSIQFVLEKAIRDYVESKKPK